MKVYTANRKSSEPKSKAKNRFSRRYFIKSTAMLVSLYFIPLSACKRVFNKQENRPENNKLSVEEKEILGKVQEHLLPSEGEGPGAQDINALKHFEFVLADKHLETYNRKLLLNGIRWVEETSTELFNRNVNKLSIDQLESVLRDLESFKNGEKWLSKIISYLFEALLGAPAYDINKEEIGWKWLGHVPGLPQPKQNKIYGNYGYGV